MIYFIIGLDLHKSCFWLCINGIYIHIQGDSVDVVRTSTGYISAYANNLRAIKRNIIQFHIDSMYKYT